MLPSGAESGRCDSYMTPISHLAPQQTAAHALMHARMHSRPHARTHARTCSLSLSHMDEDALLFPSVGQRTITIARRPSCRLAKRSSSAPLLRRLIHALEPFPKVSERTCSRVCACACVRKMSP